MNRSSQKRTGIILLLFLFFFLIFPWLVRQFHLGGSKSTTLKLSNTHLLPGEKGRVTVGGEREKESWWGEKLAWACDQTTDPNCVDSVTEVLGCHIGHTKGLTIWADGNVPSYTCIDQGPEEGLPDNPQTIVVDNCPWPDGTIRTGHFTMAVKCKGCSNGDVEADLGELCDDGNKKDGDGCSPDCQAIESCDKIESDGGGWKNAACQNTDKCNAEFVLPNGAKCYKCKDPVEECIDPGICGERGFTAAQSSAPECLVCLVGNNVAPDDPANTFDCKMKCAGGTDPVGGVKLGGKRYCCKCKRSPTECTNGSCEGNDTSTQCLQTDKVFCNDPQEECTKGKKVDCVWAGRVSEAQGNPDKICAHCTA